MYRRLSSLLMLTASSWATLATAQVTTLFPQYTRNIIYDTPVVTSKPDTTKSESSEIGVVLTPAEAEVLNDLFFEDVEVKPELPPENNYTWADSVIFCFTYNPNDPYPLLPAELRPTVFDTHHLLSPLPLENSYRSIGTGVIDPMLTEWLTRANDQAALMRATKQNYIVNNPWLIKYDESKLPEPPKQFTATVDPSTATILFKEVIAKNIPVKEMGVTFERKHWLKNFNASLQFSQAYVSPNWYQGGNNNLNGLLTLFYNVKLNTAFHPKWLFDNTFQYKLGVNNAPNDELRDYSISQDIFQWNMTVGYKSSKHWYYSVSTQFKTQFLNNYVTNTTRLKAAFMSPGELNVGVGMTYNISNPKKTFTFDASISPLSYNMKTCIHKDMNVASFGIEPGRKTVSEYGSSGEGKMTWKICDNISLSSRLFAFTDYDYIQGDWENTIMFTVNRFLTTQIYVHARYDSTTSAIEDSKWHKLQLNEVLSFGFTYRFVTGG